MTSAQAIVNVEPREIERLTLPGLHEVVWEDREYLGWRDPGSPQRGYIVFWDGDEPVGIMVRAADLDAPPRPGDVLALPDRAALGSGGAVLGTARRGRRHQGRLGGDLHLRGSRMLVPDPDGDRARTGRRIRRSSWRIALPGLSARLAAFAGPGPRRRVGLLDG